MVWNTANALYCCCSLRHNTVENRLASAQSKQFTAQSFPNWSGNIAPEKISRFTVCVVTSKNRQFQILLLRKTIHAISHFSQLDYGMSTMPERGVFEMKWLTQCPVNFNSVCNGTNQELRVGIYFKSPSFTHLWGDTARIEKRQLSAVSWLSPAKAYKLSEST